MSKRLEAIQIVLVAKNGAAPGNVAGVSSDKNDPSVTSTTTTKTPVEKPVEQTIYKTGVDVSIHFWYCVDWDQGTCEERTYVVHNVDPDVWWPASDTHAEKALIAEYGLDPEMIAGIGAKAIIGAYYSDGSYYSFTNGQFTAPPIITKDTEGYTVPCDHDWVFVQESYYNYVHSYSYKCAICGGTMSTVIHD